MILVTKSRVYRSDGKQYRIEHLLALKEDVEASRLRWKVFYAQASLFVRIVMWCVEAFVPIYDRVTSSAVYRWILTKVYRV